MQLLYPVVRSWLCAPVLVLAVSASSQAQIAISFGSRDGADDEQQIELALAQRGSLDVVEKPLVEVVHELSRQFRVQMVLSHKKLEEASVSPDTPITKKLNSLPLQSLLHLILADMELGFTVRDNVLLISTPEDIERKLEARIYPILDLVMQRLSESSGAPLYSEPDYDSLIEVIISAVEPDSWDQLGGPGSINALYNAGALVVSQTRDAHRRIEELLRSLRNAKIKQGIPSLPIPDLAGQRATLGFSIEGTSTTSAIRRPSWKTPQVYSDR